MKKTKLTLGLVGALVAGGALAACSEVTYDEGVLLTYTDASGNRIKYTAEDLFGDYQNSASSASTAYSKVKEVLIRQYYQEPAQASKLADLQNQAQNAVDGIKSQAETNANSNGTTYQEEFEALLESNNVDNVDELLDLKLYELEEEQFNKDYYTTGNLAKMRDGSLWDGLRTAEAEAEFGPVSDGYLKTRMPYHVSHILVKFESASNNEHAQATISATESEKLGDVIKELAGADTSDNTHGTVNVAQRLSFGSIAYELSDDTESSSAYGDLGIMDLSTEFVPEFKLGLYAYDALYSNQSNNSYATEEMKGRLLPSEDAKLDDGSSVKQEFVDRGLGTIPYGAAVALADASVSYSATSGEPDLGYQVNENSATYYPRNILFNKYFNNHQIAVITPNRISYNDLLDGESTSGALSGDAYNFAAETNADGTPNTTGTLDADYAALPGFSVDTTGVLPDIGSNVLTNEKGQIILAVRAGTSSYQGIHFIVADRSALSEYGLKYDRENATISEYTKADYDAGKATSNITSLNDYYSMLTPDRIPSNPSSVTAENEANYYPYYVVDGKATPKTTYINKLVSADSSYADKAKDVQDAVENFDSNLDNYIFQELLNSSKVTFADADFGKLIKDYIRITRQKSVDDTQKSFDDDWVTYAEYLEQQDAARTMKENGSQKLISETCAIGYNSEAAREGTGVWAYGGACYDGK